MKNLFNTTVLSLALAAATLLTGCSAKIDGSPFDDLGAAGGDTSFSDKVTGPSLDGKWTSECTDSWRHSGKFEIITLEVANRNVTRKVVLFVDANCISATSGGKTEVGTFRYASANSDGSFEIDYRFNMPNGTYKQYEAVQLLGSSLYISNQIGGGNPDVRMTRL